MRVHMKRINDIIIVIRIDKHAFGIKRTDRQHFL